MCEIFVRDFENNSMGYRRSKSIDNFVFLKKSFFKWKFIFNFVDFRVVYEVLVL